MGDQLCGILEIAGGDPVRNRGVRVALCPVPRRGSTMQLGCELGRNARELAPQQIAEELVVAVPLAARVERDEEQVRPRHRLQLLRTIVPTGHGVAQRPEQPLEDRRLEEEIT